MLKSESKKLSQFSNEELLDYLIEVNPKFFGKDDKDGGKYLRVTSRYDAWLLTTALSNLVLIDKVNELIKIMKEKK